MKTTWANSLKHFAGLFVYSFLFGLLVVYVRLLPETSVCQIALFALVSAAGSWLTMVLILFLFRRP